MNIKRILKHTTTTHGAVKRAFPSRTLEAIEAAVKASERTHVGEIRFAVEAALDGLPLFKGQSPRERAIELFAQLGVWDTEHNNGLLIYILLADRAVEIVADRGIHSKVGAEEWSSVCRRMNEAFSQSNYERGAIDGIEAVTRHLANHFPVDRRMRNELSDAPVVL